MSQAVTAHGGSEAASLRVAEQYLSAFGQIAKAGNTLLLPAATNDPANMVAQALSIYKTVAGNHPSTGPRYVLCSAKEAAKVRSGPGAEVSAPCYHAAADFCGSSDNCLSPAGCAAVVMHASPAAYAGMLVQGRSELLLPDVAGQTQVVHQQ